MYDYKTPLDAVDQPRPKPRFGKAIAIKVVPVVGTLALAGMIGIVVATRCGYTLGHQAPAGGGPFQVVQFREQLPAILRRENSEESIPGLQPYDYSAPVGSEISGSVASGGAIARATGEDARNETNISTGVSVPVITQTSLNTVYTIPALETNTTQTSLTTTIVIVPSGTHTCTSLGPEETETIVVTVTVVPEVSPPPAYGTPPNDATVTGNPTTVTDVQTDVSYTSGAPDATVSGIPSTITDVQTDTHYTSGVPDATISGEPSTVTSVITNTAGEPMTTLTFTSINTVIVTVTTVTRSVSFDSSVLGLPHTTTSGYSSSPVLTHTETVTVTDGPPVTVTTTVELPQYGNDYPTPYGTGLPINVTTSPTYVPPMVSAGTEGCSRSVAYLVIAALAAVCLY